jgi:hypothetical protein
VTALRIAPGLELPLDAVTQAIAILARRGAGKTHTASVLVEEVVKAEQPVVVLDPTGAWWGLRSSANGARAGLPVTILGGERGDVPLEAAAGRLIADLVVEHPGAYVIDLSGFESKAAEQRFVADFLERLYRAKATHREALLLVVDEADGYAPQRPGPEQTRTLGALESIVRRGRIRGLGAVLITQRAAVLNKNVLTQVEVLMILQTTGPQDRAAIEQWIEGNGTTEERARVLGSLAGLERGEAWVWSPSWLRTLKRVRIRARETFDSSRTPVAGERRIQPKAFAAVDLARLGERIRATAEQAKANDPAELRRRITALERELTALRATRPAPVVGKQELKTLEILVGKCDGLTDVARRLLERVGGAQDRPPAPHPAPRPAPMPPRPPAGDPARPVVHRPTPPVHRPTPPPIERRADVAGATIATGERRVLTAIAQHPEGVTREQLTILTGFKRSTRDLYLQRLRARHYVGDGGVGLVATDDGRAVLGPSFEPLPTGDELRAYWLARLPEGERRVLGVIVVGWPGAVDRDTVSEATGYKRSTRDLYLQRLASRRLVENVGRGALRASGALFS